MRLLFPLSQFLRPLPISRRLSSSRQSPTTMSTKTLRGVKRVVIAREQSEGDGARVRRSIGRLELRHLDPFLMLDEFFVKPPAGFPKHPHRGQETVTYMLEGRFTHEDNKGHKGNIGPLDLQWMTAGKGIVHSEMPATEGGGLAHGLQLWVNLAPKDKMVEPAYQELLAKDVPTTYSPDKKVEVRVIAGKSYDVESKVYTRTPTMYLDVKMEPDVLYEDEIPAEYAGFVYVLGGKALVGPKELETKHGGCVVLDEGNLLKIKSGKDGARFVVIAGKPIGAPVVQHGPFVMNTREEIQQAFADYHAGKF